MSLINDVDIRRALLELMNSREKINLTIDKAYQRVVPQLQIISELILTDFNKGPSGMVI